MDFCGFDLTFRSNVCRIVIAPLPQKGSLRYHLFGDPGRGNDTGKPWHRLVTGIFQGSLLLSTQGQRHLSYVQANGKVSHYAPGGGHGGEACQSLIFRLLRTRAPGVFPYRWVFSCQCPVKKFFTPSLSSRKNKGVRTLNIRICIKIFKFL